MSNLVLFVFIKQRKATKKEIQFLISIHQIFLISSASLLRCYYSGNEPFSNLLRKML